MGLSWFRVDVAMVDHPRTYALCDRLNDPRAGWYVIRLWSWVMRYAARGRLSDGARTALERACEWGGQAGELVQALIDVGWLEIDPAGGLSVHDWDEHQGAAVEKAEKDSERKREDRKRRGNGAETARAELADGAETARGRRADGAGTRRDETRRDSTRRKKDISGDGAQVLALLHPLQSVWNDNRAPSMPEWRETSPTRKKHADARLKERPPEEWADVVRRLAVSDFASGRSGKWSATPDWLVSNPGNAAKVLEGNYDNRGQGQSALPVFEETKEVQF